MTDTTPQHDIVYCAECSRAAGEQLFVSAPRADAWLLLEYDGPWGNKALPESDLPASVQERIERWQNATPNSKFCFIRRPSPRAQDELTLFLAVTREIDPILYHFRLAGYDGLLNLDLEALTAVDALAEDHVAREPILTVCVNGRRDLSCARYGTPVYAELEKLAPDSVWQSTHIGGHRFAGTGAVLPWGLVYGYLDADDAQDVLNATRRGEIHLDKARGRSCYEPPVLAADYFLRGAEGIYDLPGLRLISSEQNGDDQWTVRLEHLAGGQQYDVRVRRALSTWTTYESTGDTTPKHMPQFHLTGYSAVEPA